MRPARESGAARFRGERKIDEADFIPHAGKVAFRTTGEGLLC